MFLHYTTQVRARLRHVHAGTHRLRSAARPLKTPGVTEVIDGLLKDLVVIEEVTSISPGKDRISDTYKLCSCVALRKKPGSIGESTFKSLQTGSS